MSDDLAYANAKEIRRLVIRTLDDEYRFFVTVLKTVVDAIFSGAVHSTMKSTNQRTDLKLTIGVEMFGFSVV